MSTWIAALVLVVVVAAAITVKLLVRRRTPMAVSPTRLVPPARCR